MGLFLEEEMMKLFKSMLLTIIFGAGLATTAANAEDVQKMKISFLFPQGHWLWEHGGAIFKQKAEEATGGKVTFAEFPAGQLGKQTAGAVANGLAEFGIVVPSYEADKLPLTSVGELPGMHETACEGTAKLWNLAKEGGILYEKELKPLGLRALYVNILPSYRIFTTSKTIDGLETVKGLKIRANGAAMDKTARAIGSVPVKVPSPEMYDSLSRGTVDGAFYPTFSVKTDNLENLLKHGIIGPKLGGGSTLFVMNEAAWGKLDQATKDALGKAGLEAQKDLCTWLDKYDVEVTKELEDQKKVEFITLTEAQNAEWNDSVKVVSEQWANDLAASGRDGKAVLDAFKSAPTDF